uniref:Uncharacterized protein n=1 Tax=Salix viminalis TaxID=40686 RepID=A0A6N2KN83_SALVM
MPTLNHQPVTTNSAPQVSSCAGPNTSSEGRLLVSAGQPLSSAAITGDKSGRRSDHMQLSQEKNQDQESY